MFRASDPSQAALPLAALTAAVLDTETTGLDTKAAHIVQIGAVRLRAGRLESDEVFEELVKPPVPIPGTSTAIHGIKDEDVAGAADFAAVMPRLAAWVGADLVLGYAIGFDLAVLKREHERAGLVWKRPRALDVAHLAQYLAPTLPSLSLEAVATWLGIAVRDRHQALGDAVVTGEIFLALLGRLRDKGIFTLAEAERACLALTDRMDGEAEAGWQETVTAKRQRGVENRFGWTRVDSFPYRHRLRDVMHAPPVLLADSTPVGAALKTMIADRVSSVFLTSGEEDAGAAILTERDILRAVDGEGPEALGRPASTYASRPLVALDEGEFAYRAVRRMAAAGIRHLGVCDSEGRLVGALSARDLLRRRASEMVTLGEDIENAQVPAELGRVWGGLASVAEALDREEVDARDIAAIISEQLRTMTRRACELAEQEFLDSGRGPPPVPYAVLVLGSGGRGESLLAMDQDNAIVYESGAPGGAEDQWFEALGKRVADILDSVGVAYCKGGVMASNASWRMSLDDWRKTVAAWIKTNRPENLLNADIFFDSRIVHGEKALGDRLLGDAWDAARQSPPFLSALSARAGDVEDPMGWFGRFKLDQGRLDLKRSGLMALFSTARVLALRFAIRRHATRDRFAEAKTHLGPEKEAVNDLIEAHRIILDAILDQQLYDLEEGIPLSNRVEPGRLSNLQRENLKWALGRIGLTANLLGIPAKM